MALEKDIADVGETKHNRALPTVEVKLSFLLYVLYDSLVWKEIFANSQRRRKMN